jgi:hypothetical protein
MNKFVIISFLGMLSLCADNDFEHQIIKWEKKHDLLKKYALFTEEQLQVLRDSDASVKAKIDKSSIKSLKFPVTMSKFISLFGLPVSTSTINNQRNEEEPVLLWKYDKLNVVVCLSEDEKSIVCKDIFYLDHRNVSSSLIPQ